jgi:hypothetical protein
MKLTICGSMVFYKEMKEIQHELESQGHDVRIPLLDDELPPEFGGGRTLAFGAYIEENGGIDKFNEGDKIWDFKAAAIRDHFDKVEWSDAIVVVNHDKRGVEGYIGGNTLMEMGLAFYLNKPIYMLNAVSSDLLYKQEVMGMKPTFLAGDLSKIKTL